MSSVRVPSNVSSITFASSGTLVPDGNSVVTGENDAELTILDQGAKLIYSDINSGAVQVAVPAIITSITVSGIVYAVSGMIVDCGTYLSAMMPAMDATLFLQQNFRCVVG